jgi:hypothetical protein
LTFAWSAAFAAGPPLPEMAVPKVLRPPVIDGKMAPGEWDRAAACSGFVKAFEGGLAKAQSTAWIAYDDTYIYVAFRNYRGPQLGFLTVAGRRADEDRIVADPSNEVWITPPAAPQATYQSVFNAYPAVFDVKMIPSVGSSSKAWSGKWEVASSQDAESWTVEARAPLEAFGVAHIADGAEWRGLFATDILADGDKFRAWAPGGAFADIPRHGFLHFTASGPAFQLLDMDTVFSGRPELSMAVAGATSGRSPVRVTVRYGSGVESGVNDVVLNKTVDPAPGATERLSISADLAGRASGFCEITAKSGERVLYHQTFPFVVNGFVRRPPAVTKTTPYDQAFGLEASYAPLSKKLLVRIDRYYMPRRTQIASGRVSLIDPRSNRTVAERPIAAFFQDFSEFPVDLKDLQVPVETQQDWERVKLRKDPAGAVPPLEFRLRAVLTSKDGKEEASAAIPVKLLGYQFSWMPNQIGVSDSVLGPWTPLEHSQGTVSVWNKKYTLDATGLAAKIVNGGAPQLAGPMKLEAVADGKTLVFAGPQVALEKQTAAAADFKGQAQAGPLSLKVNTRVEFDGFVMNTMTVESTKANVSRLSLVVDLPEREAPYFVTTSGGWSSYFGKTPDRWDSRESSITSMVGNFVPYILLTDSERGFCWFADNEKGWRLDPAAPTQEVLRHGGLVTLRVNFINKAGPIERPMTVRYGWMATPQKPQPRGWRGYLIGSQKYFPQATPVFWNDADWAVSWPYYSSPYPKNYEKSRMLLAQSAAKGVTGCVGNIAHAIARYVDYEGRQFPALASEWGITPGETGDGNVARSRGPNDFQLFHFDRWSKLSGLGCLYFDENYLTEDRNYLTGGAYLLPDERVQPGYNYLGLRDYNKRLRYMFHDNGKAAPNLWQHTTAGQAVYAWMPDVSMEAENVEPVDLTSDYLEALPASRLRSIGMGRNLGSAPFIMDQASRHGKGAIAQALAHQLVGWVLAHDALPEQTAFWPVLSSELELWRDDVRFLPYWEHGLGVEPVTAGVDVSAHVRTGNAVLWVVNENREDTQAVIKLDPAKLGLDASRPVVAYDAENRARYLIANGSLTVPVPKRMWRAVRLFQPRQLGGELAFVASFDNEPAADEAYGGRYPLGGELPTLVPGKEGQGLPIDRPVVFPLRQHIGTESGAIRLVFRAVEHSTGTLMSLGGLDLGLANGRITLSASGKAVAPVGPVAAGPGWNELALSWQGHELQVAYNGAEAFVAPLAPLPLVGCGRGFEIRDPSRHIEPSAVRFGPLRGTVIDDLRMALKP